MALRLDLDPEWEACYQFMIALRTLQPLVLEELSRVQISTHYWHRRGTVVTVRVGIPPEIRAWAGRWNLESEPIMRFAASMIRAWSEGDARLRQELHLARPKPLRIAWEHYPEDFSDPGNPYASIGAQPDYETLKEFLERARVHYQARVKVDKRKSRRGHKLDSQHFEYLVRRMFLNENPRQILRAMNISKTEDTVRKGYTSAARVLKLTIAPRPRRSRRLSNDTM
jgi:hypothetical protein